VIGPAFSHGDKRREKIRDHPSTLGQNGYLSLREYPSRRWGFRTSIRMSAFSAAPCFPLDWQPEYLLGNRTTSWFTNRLATLWNRPKSTLNSLVFRLANFWFPKENQ